MGTRIQGAMVKARKPIVSRVFLERGKVTSGQRNIEERRKSRKLKRKRRKSISFSSSLSQAIFSRGKLQSF